MKILALIVTFNRKEELFRCIQSIKSQHLPPDDILVVNNNSTDGTEKLLISNKINFITQYNNGSATGWYTGINYAIKNEYDYIWLMDDDGYPDFQALQILINSFSYNKKAVCISSAVVDEINSNTFIFPYPKLDKNNNPQIFSFKRKYKNTKEINNLTVNHLYPYAQLFNGALISIKAINKIGNINKDYFIFGEEVDYYYRLKEIGNIFTNFKALHYHPNVSNRKYTLTKIYYYVKNSIINNNKYFNYVPLRNLFVVLIVLVRSFNRNGFLYFLSLIIGNKSYFFYLSIFRGIKGRLGKDFNEKI